jgi:AAA+ ATPase superfamily predicted ATPase
MAWGFYGRRAELTQLQDILSRNRWFFAKVVGRRRIGKTTLIQEALRAAKRPGVLYVQIPDSGPAGVLSAVDDAFETFGIDPAVCPRPHSLSEFAKAIGVLAQAGYVVALDEFQYFTRAHLSDFPSFLQREVDALSAKASAVSGGLLVLGSIHAEIQALLEDKAAPLFNRTTDEILLSHFDIASVLDVLRHHATPDPGRLLSLWTLFEGVPKFYRDCFEQGVLGSERSVVLQRMFFESSSPLRTEADNWFLKELKGRYDVVLKYVARHEGCTNGELEAHVKEISRETDHQVAGYLKILIERYRLIDKKLPIFAKPKARAGRYYIADNFLAAWLAALASNVSALAFSPIDQLVANAAMRMNEVEGHAFEKLVAQLYEERSRKKLGDFPLSSRVEGYWDSADTELDLVALDEAGRRIRFGSCKRSEAALAKDISTLHAHAQRFLDQFPKYKSWAAEFVGFSPVVSLDARKAISARGVIVQDLADLTAGL